ncbi:MAG TPA: FtsW/RodA/SpoVE family cell cycle protein [Pseudonocardiaceae bacterium]|jgi:cell division protein FtsW (lipid II flippase)|nr:FtsW/RodA/SpoVE family cell cycle protein [Pseudonocardiaceae bacterium]
MSAPVPDGAGGSAGSAVSPAAQPDRPPGTPTRRGTELVLLAFASVLVTAALVLVEANQEQQLTMQIVYYGLSYLALFGGAHIAVRRWAPYADPIMLPCVALLNGIGLVMIHRLDLAYAASAAQAGHTYTAEAPKQMLWTTVGLVMFVLVLAFVKDHRTLSRYGYTFGLVGVAAFLLPGLLPSSLSAINGAKVWLLVGPFSLQPGEFAKILLIIFFAAFLVAKRDLFMAAGRTFAGIEWPRPRDLGPLVLALAISVGALALEKDLGNSLLIFGIVLVMVYVATERAAWIIIGLVPFIGSCVLAYKMFTHVQQRVANWIDPFTHYATTGYQLSQALFGLGTGGIFGTGLGAGRPSLVPEANSDFIISSIGEELGLLGLFAVLVLYMLLAMRGLRGAVAVRDTFGKLLGGGLAFSLLWQVFVVVGGVTKLIPETGLTSPWLSAGGSSVMANYLLLALLLRISDTARKPRAGTSRPKLPDQPIAEASTVLVERPS